MKKLSPTQATLLAQMKAEIERARSFETFEARAREKSKVYAFYARRGLSEAEIFATKDLVLERETYENAKAGIVLAIANGATLKKLEALGFIEILHDTTGTWASVDTVKVLNF